MTDKTIVIDKNPGRVLAWDEQGSVLVNRVEVANAANALLGALRGEPATEGVVLLARALGCVEKQAND